MRVGKMREEEPVRVVGRIKWFNQFKGYGFVEAENIPGDVFLHFSSVNKSGIERLNNNDVILCEVINSDKGYQVSAIVELLHMNKHEIESEQKCVEAVMKWFNPLKGFGFAQLDSKEDVFIHSSLLKKHKLTTIEAGEKIELIVRRTNLGYEAVDMFFKGANI
jgi:CspA family cold shock protein